MMGISYGAYRPVVGFAVMLLFETIAFLMTLLAVNKVKTAKSDNEIFEEADASLTDKLNSCLSSLSFAGFFTSLSVIMISLPLILIRSEFEKSVLEFGSYIRILLIIFLVLAAVFLGFKDIYSSWIAGKTVDTGNSIQKHRVRMMNIIQLAVIIAAGVLLTVAPCFLTDEEGISIVNILAIAGLILMFSSLVVFVVFFLREKEYRKALILPGIRNILFIIPIYILQGARNISTIQEVNELWEKSYESYELNYGMIAASIGTALLIFIVFKIIDKFFHKYY